MSRERFQTKEALALTRALRKLGATVEPTAKDHLKVTGPAGYAVIPGKIGHGHALRLALRLIRKHTGLDV